MVIQSPVLRSTYYLPVTALGAEGTAVGKKKGIAANAGYFEMSCPKNSLVLLGGMFT